MLAYVLFRELNHVFMVRFCVINARMIKIVIYSPFFIQVQGIFLLKI